MTERVSLTYIFPTLYAKDFVQFVNDFTDIEAKINFKIGLTTKITLTTDIDDDEITTEGVARCDELITKFLTIIGKAESQQKEVKS